MYRVFLFSARSRKTKRVVPPGFNRFLEPVLKPALSGKFDDFFVGLIATQIDISERIGDLCGNRIRRKKRGFNAK
jgi:hypothetical protein